MKEHLVFVYGTLRSGERNHRLLKHAELVANPCWTYGNLYDVGCGYPALELTDTKGRVKGELYSVSSLELAKLNELEGYQPGRADNLYDRVEREVFVRDKSYTAFFYIFSKEQVKELQLIKSGDWKYR